jgi:hypothetical protein
MADKDTKSSDKPMTNTKQEVVQPQTGGVTNAVKDTNTPHDPFATTGNEPVRDREPDTSKGTPVTRFFTRDGTPVEPSTVPPAVTPSNLAGQDPDKRDDVVAVVEYLDESGSTVTHDSLAARKEEEKSAST